MTSRNLARGVSAWLFGLATTVFLIAVWGRAVVVDVDSLEEAAAPLADSSAVVELFTGWLDEELAEADVAPVTSQMVVEEVMTRSSVVAALREFTGEFVAAAASPARSGSVVDVGRLLEPTVPEIGSALEAAGVPTPESRISEVVAGIDPLIVRGEGSAPYIGSRSPTAARLGIAAVLALVTMAVMGWVSVASSEDRLAQARSLLNRVALGALSFGILLKLGSWVLDPRGGRAPLSEAVSMIADSKWALVMMLGLGAGAGGALVWLVRRYLKPGEESPPPDERPTLRGEQQPIRSG